MPNVEAGNGAIGGGKRPEELPTQGNGVEEDDGAIGGGGYIPNILEELLKNLTEGMGG